MIKRLLLILTLLCFAAPAWSETYVVCVGISRYMSPKVSDLRLPERDAKDFAAFYKRGTENVITVTGHYATKAKILECLRSQFSRAGKGDKIVFYFSGHGYPGGFCPYDMTRIEEGLTYKEVIGIMSRSKASGKFIFADACFSGGIRQGKRGETKHNTGDVLLFLSSRSYEQSAESGFDKNGFFTKYLLKGLKGGADTNGDRSVTARELFLYVSGRVKESTRDLQHPVMWGKFDDNLKIVEYKRK